MILPIVLVAFVGGCRAFVEMQFHDCGSREGTVTAVVATECTAEPCSVNRGSTYHGYVNFTVNQDVDSVHSVLHGGLGIFSLPWPVATPNACNDGLPCPLRAGQTYSYKLDMDCPSFAPAIRIAAKWELKDGGRDIICFTIPLQIH